MNGACFCIGAQGHPSGLCPCQRRQQDWKGVSDDIFKPIHKEAADAIERLSARIAALESGQPCEVGGITGQWVPKVLTGAMQRAGYFRDWEANQTVWQSQLTASAQEMKKPQPPETPK